MVGYEEIGGPIVEQSTHMVDLARYLAESEVDLRTLTAIAIPPTDQKLGMLTDLPRPYGSKKEGETVEDDISTDFRIARATSAHWKFQSGALCSLNHGVMLHGSNIEAELEVWADGLRMRLEDPYTKCRLVVRRHSDTNPEETQTYDFGKYYENQTNLRTCDPSADPYHNEIVSFLDAVRKKDPSLIRSPYEDAYKTYQLTWAIRRASEASFQ